MTKKKVVTFFLAFFCGFKNNVSTVKQKKRGKRRKEKKNQKMKLRLTKKK